MTRLRDMGVEPFLLSSSLLGVLAQRLVRLLCPKCREGHTATASECERIGVAQDSPPTLYSAGPGCEHCNQMGYRGRTGIYELITVDDTLRTLIHDGSSEQVMEEYARRHSAGIRQDGFRRVLAGQTSLEEVLRVTNE
jgi:general secretion pathway protein E